MVLVLSSNNCFFLVVCCYHSTLNNYLFLTIFKFPFYPICGVVILCYFFLFCTTTKRKRVTKKEKNVSDLNWSKKILVARLKLKQEVLFTVGDSLAILIIFVVANALESDERFESHNDFLLRFF